MIYPTYALCQAYWLHHVEFENAVLVHPDAARRWE